jgi:hypothetical protein
MNLQSIIDNSRARDNAVAELSLAINELDLPGLERLLEHVANRIQDAQNPEFKPSTRIEQQTARIARQDTKMRNFSALYSADPKTIEAELHKKTTAKAIARAEKGVRTRKRNAAKAGSKYTARGKHAKTPKPKPLKAFSNTRVAIKEWMEKHPEGLRVEHLVNYTGVGATAVYAHLKALGAKSVRQRWHLPKLSKSMSKPNGAATP